MHANLEKPSFCRLLHLIVLLAWIVAFWFLLQGIGGSPLLGKFLRPDYWWLVESGAGILVIFLIVLVYCDAPGCGKRGASLLVQIGIITLPLLYLPTAVTSHLSPEAIKKRSFYMAQPDTITKDGLFNRASRPGDSEDTPLLHLVTDPGQYEGKRVSVTGQIYWDDNLPENLFLCYQLLMICCAADARPIGVMVEYDKLKALNIGDWVRVEGTVGPAEIRGKKIIRISAEKAEPTQAPRDPYLLQ